MSETISITLTLLRRSEDAPTLFNDGPNYPTKGTIYIEYTETWEKDRGDEMAKNKRLVERKATGRRFVYADRVSPEEFARDAGVENGSLHSVVDPNDFFHHRLIPA